MVALAPRTAWIESSVFYEFLFFDIAGMMLLGMALFKLGVFSATRSYTFYATLVFAGYAIGLPLGAWVVYDWAVRHAFGVGTRMWVFFDVERIAVALGHVGAGVVEEILFRGFTVTRLIMLTGRIGLAAALTLVGFAALHVPVWGWGFALGGLASGAAAMAFFVWRRDLLAMVVFHTITDATGLIIASGFSDWWKEPAPS